MTAEAEPNVRGEASGPVQGPVAAELRPVGGQPSDELLLAGCRRGDPVAWQTVVARYERLVFSVALRNGLDHEDAADVTQTVFLALLNAVDTIEREDRLAYWLMTVTRRHAWRARSRRHQELPVSEVEGAAEDPIADWELGEAVRTSIAQLAAPCRDLLTALYLDPTEPSYAEISQRLGRAIGGLGPMRARCLQRLRQMMEEGEQ